MEMMLELAEVRTLKFRWSLTQDRISLSSVGGSCIRRVATTLPSEVRKFRPLLLAVGFTKEAELERRYSERVIVTKIEKVKKQDFT